MSSLAHSHASASIVNSLTVWHTSPRYPVCMNLHIRAGFVEHLDRQRDYRRADNQLRLTITPPTNQCASTLMKCKCNSTPRCGTQGSWRAAASCGVHAGRPTIAREVRVFTQFLVDLCNQLQRYERRRYGRTTRELTRTDDQSQWSLPGMCSEGTLGKV